MKKIEKSDELDVVYEHWRERITMNRKLRKEAKEDVCEGVFALPGVCPTRVVRSSQSGAMTAFFLVHLISVIHLHWWWLPLPLSVMVTLASATSRADAL